MIGNLVECLNWTAIFWAMKTRYRDFSRKISISFFALREISKTEHLAAKIRIYSVSLILLTLHTIIWDFLWDQTGTIGLLKNCVLYRFSLFLSVYRRHFTIAIYFEGYEVRLLSQSKISSCASNYLHVQWSLQDIKLYSAYSTVLNNVLIACRFDIVCWPMLEMQVRIFRKIARWLFFEWTETAL